MSGRVDSIHSNACVGLLLFLLCVHRLELPPPVDSQVLHALLNLLSYMLLCCGLRDEIGGLLFRRSCHSVSRSVTTLIVFVENDLLGEGQGGRVYRVRYNGADIAVKYVKT